MKRGKEKKRNEKIILDLTRISQHPLFQSIQLLHLINCLIAVRSLTQMVVLNKIELRPGRSSPRVTGGHRVAPNDASEATCDNSTSLAGQGGERKVNNRQSLQPRVRIPHHSFRPSEEQDEIRAREERDREDGEESAVENSPLTTPVYEAIDPSRLSR